MEAKRIEGLWDCKYCGQRAIKARFDTCTSCGKPRGIENTFYLPDNIEEAVLTKEEALKSGAECQFPERYPDVVTVYQIGDVSKEICGGPHVKNTSELGKFKIKKEEASSSGVRRIKAILE